MGMNHAMGDERPVNGLAGLKNWRHDIVAGMLVSLVSLPLSTGIAIASGAPPITGLISAIIAGLLLPFLGGSYVTISGPAAGLAPALLAGMTLLGHGDLSKGYPLLLAVICMVGCVQIVLSLLKTAKFSAIFPSTVVEAMLASIGLLIIVKQIPFLFGVKAPGVKPPLPHDFKAHDFFEFLMEAPSKVAYIHPKVFALTIFCLTLIFTLGAIKARWAKVIPPQLVAVLVGVLLGWAMGFSGPSELIEFPDHVLDHGFTFPHFADLFSDSSLWKPALVILVTLTLIDGVESLATASAVDRIDPWRRKSDPNRVLLAMGISNICSSLAGGLTIIPGGVKSKACIEGGGRTLWANFFNAIFLIIYLVVATPLINRIPYAALAAVLIHTGYKLCRPAIWKHTARLGREQIALFALTVVVTLLTDLLWGIIFGVVAKFLMTLLLISKSVQGGSSMANGQGSPPPPVRASDLFRNPVSGRNSRRLVPLGVHPALGLFQLDPGRRRPVEDPARVLQGDPPPDGPGHADRPHVLRPAPPVRLGLREVREGDGRDPGPRRDVHRLARPVLPQALPLGVPRAQALGHHPDRPDRPGDRPKADPHQRRPTSTTP